MCTVSRTCTKNYFLRFRPYQQSLVFQMLSLVCSQLSWYLVIVFWILCHTAVAVNTKTVILTGRERGRFDCSVVCIETYTLALMQSSYLVYKPVYLLMYVGFLNLYRLFFTELYSDSCSEDGFVLRQKFSGKYGPGGLVFLEFWFPGPKSLPN